MNICRFPCIPYPYSSDLRYYIFSSQAIPSFQYKLTIGISKVSGYQKKFFWPDIILLITRLGIEPIIYKYVLKGFNYFGYYKNVEPTLDFEMISSMIKILTETFHIELLDTQAELSRNAEQEDEYCKAMVMHRIKKEEAEDRLKKIRETRLQYTRENNPFNFKKTARGFLPAFISGMICDFIFYPFAVTNFWLTASYTDSSWRKTFRQVLGSTFSGNKNIYDSFIITEIGNVVNSWLLMPPMLVLKKLMKIPDEAEMPYHLNYIFLALFASHDNPLGISNEEFKAEVHYSFSALWKNTVAFIISDWLVKLSIYPLISLRNRVACRGMAPYCKPLSWRTLFTQFFNGSLYWGIDGMFLAVTFPFF